MSDGSLTQDEIDALLQGADELAPEATTSVAQTGSAGQLKDNEKTVLLDIARMEAGSASSTLSTITTKKIELGNPAVFVRRQDEMRAELKGKYVQMRIDFTEGVMGENLYLLKQEDALVVADLMMSQDGTNPPSELNDLYLSAITEAISQINGSITTMFSNRVGTSIRVTPPQIEVISDPARLLLPAGDSVVEIKFDFTVEGLLKSSFIQVLSIQFARELISITLGESPRAAFVRPAATAAAQPQMPAGLPGATPQVAIQQVQLPSLAAKVKPEQLGNIGLLMDVPMQLTVELGRTRMLIKEILGLGEGSIIELDKLAGEPVDLLVNNKLIAKGEVVVIDENFGVRVTDIISPIERINNLQ